MAIRKGEEWGWPDRLPADSPVVHTNEQLYELIRRHMLGGTSVPTVGLLGGDLCRTVGGSGRSDRLHGVDAHTLPCDIVEATVDGAPFWFAAHLVARQSWLTGPLSFAMNAAWRGTWNVGPRAHPGDGFVDVFETSMSAGERLRGMRRVPHGGHVPHPDISVRKMKSGSIGPASSQPRRVTLDGVDVGRAWTVTLRVLPELLLVVV